MDSSVFNLTTAQEQRNVTDFGSGESSDDNDAITFNDPDFNCRQLQLLTERVSSTLSQKDADAAYKEYAKVKNHTALCRSLLRTSAPRRVKGNEPQRPSGPDTRSSTENSALEDFDVAQGLARLRLSGHDRGTCLAAIRDWKRCMESLLKALQQSLCETYKNYDPDATSAMADSLFNDVDFRASVIQQMRNSRIGRTSSTSPDFWRVGYDVRFRNYDGVKQGMAEVSRILQLGESGLSSERLVKEHDVSPHGDAVLEFANLGAESMPVLRFRVSSYMLAETSPIFERMFTKHTRIGFHDDDDDVDIRLPPPPTPYTCRDGTEAKLYRMPQMEHDKEQAFRILLHAAHMHNHKVPREVPFEQLVAIADVCLRYRCTSPLELFVEHRWLPQWIHKGSEEMPDGLLLVSYVFGLRQLFTRMSKTAVLNLSDEKELRSMPWPQRIKDKIWAVRRAKMAQLHACCVNLIQEYLRPPSKATQEDGTTSSSGTDYAPNRSWSAESTPAPMPALSSTPRCPKGDHWCDATNLGWLMLVYGELQLLPTIMRPATLSHLPDSQHPQSRSLAQLVDVLRTIACAPQAVHRGGVCDPAPQLRAAVNDVYNSVTGLTLHDISGRAHGWGLSRHRSGQPQSVLGRGMKKDRRMTDVVRLGILKAVEGVDELRAVALADRGFYRLFKENEVGLTRRFVRAHRRMTLNKLTSMDVVERGENKVMKEEADALKAEVGSRGGEADVAESGRDEDVGGASVVGPSDLSSSKMNDEEARRILWPDSPAAVWTLCLRPKTPDCGMKEKFRIGDLASVEDKMLVEAEGKQLREQRDIRVGLVRECG